VELNYWKKRHSRSGPLTVSGGKQPYGRLSRRAALRPLPSFQGASASLECRRSAKRGGSRSYVRCGVA
jgi:hypothetical protein